MGMVLGNAITLFALINRKKAHMRKLFLVYYYKCSNTGNGGSKQHSAMDSALFTFTSAAFKC